MESHREPTRTSENLSPRTSIPGLLDFVTRRARLDFCSPQAASSQAAQAAAGRRAEAAVQAATAEVTAEAAVQTAAASAAQGMAASREEVGKQSPLRRSPSTTCRSPPSAPSSEDDDFASSRRYWASAEHAGGRRVLWGPAGVSAGGRASGEEKASCLGSPERPAGGQRHSCWDAAQWSSPGGRASGARAAPSCGPAAAERAAAHRARAGPRAGSVRPRAGTPGSVRLRQTRRASPGERECQTRPTVVELTVPLRS
ncbi:unnamed protein product, partial [Prorocentrum cordatum]